MRPVNKIRRKKGAYRPGPILAPSITPGKNSLGRLSLPSKGLPSKGRKGWKTTGLRTKIRQTDSAFASFRIGPQPVSDLTFTKVLYTSEQFDINEEYNTATGNFIPQQGGVYSLFASIEFFPTTPASGQQYFVQIFIQVNGTVVAQQFDFFPGGESTISVSAIQQLQANNVVDVIMRSSRAGNINGTPFADARSLTRFEGARIS
ncbi:hypothetical protein C8P63_13916 [Melghirimyces profundicolus]|uniref:C1q domain-containing protein n=1 Tax=Melghirimyces profundicolus TaxID=1242148 RepID=A0A2T6B174_9BACL|nr:hypothetical protein [Melghirimyces profundicolus]PTX49821.1 hypothetical protein C8P63_13916 [Melghirimyces profundicolus]